MLSNAILVMVQTDFVFLDEFFWVCQIGKCHLKITSLIICNIFSFLFNLTVNILTHIDSCFRVRVNPKPQLNIMYCIDEVYMINVTVSGWTYSGNTSDQINFRFWFT